MIHLTLPLVALILLSCAHPLPSSVRASAAGGGSPAEVVEPIAPPIAVPLDPDAGSMICARITQGIRVDPEDLGPCEWVRRPSCPGMFVVFHQSGAGLVGTCASSLPP